MNNTVLKEQPITCSEGTRRTASEEEKRDDQHHSRPQYGSRTLLFDLRIRVLKWARQTGPLMVPAGAGPVTVAPVLPVDPVFEGGPVRVQGAEQVLDRGHGQSHMA